MLGFGFVMKKFFIVPTCLALLTSTAAVAQTASYALHGGTGLIDMPTAETLPDGENAWTVTNTGQMSGGALTFQMLPNLETTVHFTTISEWDGGRLLDQSIDFKYQIFDESGMRPAVAIGFRDFLSNGAFSSEYIVATKNVGYGLTVSGGLGWGRLGSRDPIGSIGTRPAATSTGVDYDHFFQGNIAPFAGVEWDTPIHGLSVKAEYSSDAYEGEQAFGSFTPESPLNFGIDYAPYNGVSVGAYYNYGTDVGFRITLSGNPNRPIIPSDLGRGPVPVNPRPAGYNADPRWANNVAAQDKVVAALIPLLQAEKITIEEARLTGTSIDLYIKNNSMPQTPQAIGRVVRILSVALPPSIETFRITPLSKGLATTTVEIRRSDLEAQVERPNAGPDSFRTTQFNDAPNTLGEAAWQRDAYPKFSWSLNPQIPIQLVSGGEAASFKALLRASANYQVSRGFSVSGALTQNLYSSSDEGPIGGPKLARLSADYLFKLSPSTYARVSGGYLNGKYAGVDGEVLWMPTNQNWGLGLEMAAVQRRDNNSFFGFKDEQVVTGHGSIYWDTGYHGLEAELDVGRYLDGDFGSTMRLTRRFSNGWEVSGYVTATEVSFAEFGDGNFAKGISVRIPLRWTFPSETRSTMKVGLDTSGDGGQRLGVSNRLYGVIRDYDVVDFNETWGAYWQ